MCTVSSWTVLAVLGMVALTARVPRGRRSSPCIGTQDCKDLNDTVGFKQMGSHLDDLRYVFHYVLAS